MWLSQLAYESHRKPTIETVSGEWEFSSATGFINQKIDIAGSFETCGLIGERADAVILAFSGTDPGIWENLITDFSLRPADGTDIHGGFHNAAEAARGQVEMAVRLSKEGRKPLFVTGHSLGGALAALAAQMAVASGVAPQAVYVFGMPRTGGEQFKANYNAKLGSVTYRLVYGIDVVSRVPPASLTGFRHIGRVLQCAGGSKFTPADISAVGSDDPSFSDELKNIFARGFADILSGHVLSLPGPGTFGPFFRFLPPAIRDHLQDSYWNALS